MISVGGTAILGRVHHLLSLTDKTTGDKVMSMRICKIEGCENKHEAKGYCNKHYLRIWRYGDPLFIVRTQESHGMFGTSEYQTWLNMKTRCNNKNNTKYKNYGGRDIIVCDKWKNSFLTFFKDMGPKPFPKA